MSALTIIGFALAAAGCLFAFKPPGAAKAEGAALKSLSIQGPAWLVLVVVGVAAIAYGSWLDLARLDKAVPPTAPPVTAPVDDEPFTFGDDERFDELWLACEDGDLVACDDLYLESPVGSDYEWFGATCGGTVEDPTDLCAPPE